MRKGFFSVAIFFLLVIPLAAQAPPSAERTGRALNFWVGATVSMFNPDYGCPDSSPFSCGEHQLIGVGPFLDTSYFMWGMVGLEGEARLLLWHGPATLIESSYMGGPRLRILRI